MNVTFAVGDILKDMTTSKLYRVVSMTEKAVILCDMKSEKFQLSEYDFITILQLMNDDQLRVEHEEPMVIDFSKLPLEAMNSYNVKKQVITAVMNAYGMNLMALASKTIPKPRLQEILQENNMSKSTFWRVFCKYMQSGMKDCTLVDSRYLGTNKGKEYNLEKKSGAGLNDGKVSSDITHADIIKYFEEALKEYRSGRAESFKACYDRMNMLHFMQTEIVNGVPTLRLKPASERPSMRQFIYYANKKLTKQEKDMIKTSAQEQRNNKRLITSDSMYGVNGPGDMVEIDACEVDVSLVSSSDPNQSIGRPVVYFMIDVFTRLIVAVSVSFDNNSILGITNLFLNLADNKKEYCKRFGIDFDNERLWPSNFIPRRLRVDRGSEFKSHEFNRICNELGIEKQIVTGGTGSLKGVVEQSFHQMHSKQNVHLENYGLIEKRYDSEHHKEATLNLEQYTRMIINFIFTHNQEYNPRYPLTKEMIDQGVKPIPCLLWEYGIKKYGTLRPIPVREQYLYNLMTPVKAKLNRRGICYKNLYYITDQDRKLLKEMFEAGTKKVPFESRMDMRDVGHIFYIRDNRLIIAHLNEALTGNADFNGMTMKQYEDYLEKKKKMDMEGKIHNQELAAYNHAFDAAVVDDAKKTVFSSTKNIRSSRELEKQEVSHEGKMIDRLDDTPKITEAPREEEKAAENPIETGYTSFREALDDFRNNN